MNFNVDFNIHNSTFDVDFKEEKFNPDFGTVINTGPAGATFYPHVSEDGWVSWTNNQSFSNPTPVNIMGPAGEKGDSPIKGVDYWTNEDIADITQYCDAIIREEVAKVTIGTENMPGLVKSGNPEYNNTIIISQDGTMTVPKVSITSLEQKQEEKLTLQCGNSNIEE